MDTWSKTLIHVTNKLELHEIPYVLVASGALKVLGVNIHPYDIDIFTTKENVKKCLEVFNKIKTTELYFYEDPTGKYLEFQAKKNGIPIEFCELENLLDLQYAVYYDTTIAIPKDVIATELDRSSKLKRWKTVTAIENYLKSKTTETPRRIK